LWFIYGGKIQGLACHMVLHGYEATKEHEELLDERGFNFSLLYHFENYDTSPFYGFD
jgi:hypothetical protein